MRTRGREPETRQIRTSDWPQIAFLLVGLRELDECALRALLAKS